MKIIIPECEWAKHIDNIQVDGASGYQWNGPKSNKSGFISGSVELPPGSLVIAYRLKANAVKGKAALYAAIDGPRIYQLAITTGDHNWSSTLRPKAEEFLSVNHNLRAAMICHRLITALSSSTTLMTGVPAQDEDVQNEINQLILLRRKYMVVGDHQEKMSGPTAKFSSLEEALNTPPVAPLETYDPASFVSPVPEFIRSSFRLWIGRMVRENDLSKEDVHRLIGASIDEMVTADEETRDDSPWRAVVAERRIATR
jgi:hypothetical protein